MSHRMKWRRVRVVGLLQVSVMFLAVLPTSGTARANQSDRTLNWYSNYDYSDNQTVTGRRRLIVDDPDVDGSGYTRWCVTVNEQPLITSGTQSADGLENIYIYFSRGVVTRNVTSQSEPGCWTVSTRDRADASEGFDFAFNTSSWADGQYRVKITGDYWNGQKGEKSLVLNTVNPSSRVTLASSSGGTLSGTSNLTVTFSRMSKVGQICLKRNGVAVDSTIKMGASLPNSNGCWALEKPAGAQSIGFTAETFSWPDGSHAIEAIIPHSHPEIGSGSATFSSVNPALGVTTTGVSDNEQVSGLRVLSVVPVIGAVHTAQVKPAKYCIDLNGQACTFTTTSSAASASYAFVSYAYPDGGHSLKFRAIDSAGREASRTVAFRIANGRPTVSNLGAKTVAPVGPKGRASATINFSASRATATTVFVKGGQGAASRIDVDMLSDTNETRSVNVENLQPSTKYSYEVVARNANGESKAVTGSFTTPAAPKPARTSSGSSGGSSGGSGSGSAIFPISLIGQRLDRVLSILGLSRSYARQASSCRNFEWLGIINTSNWYVVGFSGGYVYACKP